MPSNQDAIALLIGEIIAVAEQATPGIADRVRSILSHRSKPVARPTRLQIAGQEPRIAGMEGALLIQSSMDLLAQLAPQLCQPERADDPEWVAAMAVYLIRAQSVGILNSLAQAPEGMALKQRPLTSIALALAMQVVSVGEQGGRAADPAARKLLAGLQGGDHLTTYLTYGCSAVLIPEANELGERLAAVWLTVGRSLRGLPELAVDVMGDPADAIHMLMQTHNALLDPQHIRNLLESGDTATCDDFRVHLTESNILPLLKHRLPVQLQRRLDTADVRGVSLCQSGTEELVPISLAHQYDDENAADEGSFDPRQHTRH